jgi:hypothetical protein
MTQRSIRICLSLTTLALAGAAFAGGVPNDFRGVGVSDILWRNLSSGQVDIWDGGDVNAAHSIGVVNPGDGWTLVGTGDFNGDNRADIVWRNVNGLITIWPSADGTKQYSPGSPDPSWQIINIGMYADRVAGCDNRNRSGFLWQQDHTGAMTIWPGADSRCQYALPAVAQSSGWQIQTYVPGAPASIDPVYRQAASCSLIPTVYGPANASWTPWTNTPNGEVQANDSGVTRGEDYCGCRSNCSIGGGTSYIGGQAVCPAGTAKAIGYAAPDACYSCPGGYTYLLNGAGVDNHHGAAGAGKCYRN